MENPITNCTKDLAVEDDEEFAPSPMSPPRRGGLRLPGHAAKAESIEVARETGGQSLATEISAIVQLVKSLDREEAFKRLASLDDGIARSRFELGGILSRIHDNPTWFSGGFYKWVESKFGMSGSTARARMQVYNAVIKLGSAGEKLRSNDWSKVRHFASLLTKENASAWAEFAAENSKEAVIARAQAARTKVGKLVAKKSGEKKIAVAREQREVVESAIEKAKHAAGTADEAEALQHICSAYLNEKALQGVADLGPEELSDRVIAAINELELEDAQMVYEALVLKLSSKLGARG